ICLVDPASAMPRVMVRTGCCIVPAKLSLPLSTSTKIAFAASPSIPSQLSSAKLSSGTSVVDGGAQLLQPCAPLHVRRPAHCVLSGVVIVQLTMSPALAGVQSQALLFGMHCFTPPPISVQVYVGGHAMVVQSRAQNVPVG